MLRSLLLGCVIVACGCASSRAEEPLKQVKTIPLEHVAGRIDHMSITPDGRRLFVAALGNNSVEVLDTEAGTRLTSLSDVKEPQGVCYLPDSHQFAVACGEGAAVQLYDESLKRIAAIKDLDDADNVRYEPKAKLLYVGYGSGALAVIDPAKAERIADIKLDAHPESFRLEPSGKRIFVNVPGAGEIDVIDRDQRAVIAKWPVEDARANFPMSLDETNHRLFVGCRKPAKLLVLDTQTGKAVASLDCCGDTDDVFYDATAKRIYVSGGEGCISVFEQSDPDHYKSVAKLTTAAGARTSYFDAASGKLYVAVPHRGSHPAEVRVYARPG